MKTTDILENVLDPLKPFVFRNNSDGKPEVKDFELWVDRLICFTTGLIIGSELNSVQLKKLSKQVSKLNKK